MLRLLLPIFFSLSAFASDYKYQVSGDIILGDSSAPVTIIEYASFSCYGCAKFHKDTLPILEEKYIKPGKVKLIFRPYPLREVDLKASALTECAPKNQFYSFVKLLFATQQNWAFESRHPAETLEHIGRLGGISGESIKKCFTDQYIENKIVESRQIAQKELKIKATPTLIINGVVYEGGLGKERLFDIIDNHK
jgi:protein-disulfide isomerase